MEIIKKEKLIVNAVLVKFEDQYLNGPEANKNCKDTFLELICFSFTNYCYKFSEPYIFEGKAPWKHVLPVGRLSYE